jgi:phenylpyruvate tautomerase PptA (4-oxalocrotonate tautomerase family)
MPLWSFHYTAGALGISQREQLAKSITKIYTSAGMPAFYVQVRFTENPPNTAYTGGEDVSSRKEGRSNYAMIEIWHIARTFTSETAKRQFINATNKVLGRVLDLSEWKYEHAVVEGPRDLWRINGWTPPPTGSETEAKWFEENRPINGLVIGKL